MHAGTIALTLILCIGTSAPALGQVRSPAPLTTFVTGPSECPAPPDVARETLRLTPPSQQGIYASGVRVRLDDLGASYRVSIAAPGLDAAKTYIDGSRDCGRRATFAAVLVLMTLFPPQLVEEPQPSSPADPLESAESKAAHAGATDAATQPAPVRSPAPAAADTHVAVAAELQDGPISTRQRPTWLRTSFAAAATWSPPLGDSLSLATWGATWQVSAGKRAISPFVALGFGQSAPFALAGIRGRLQRWPLALGIENRLTLRHVEVSAVVGGVAILYRIRAEELVASQSRSGVEWALRFGVSTTWVRGVFSPFASVAVDYAPVARVLEVAPRGALGNTPVLQIWHGIGVRVGL